MEDYIELTDNFVNFIIEVQDPIDIAEEFRQWFYNKHGKDCEVAGATYDSFAVLDKYYPERLDDEFGEFQKEVLFANGRFIQLEDGDGAFYETSMINFLLERYKESGAYEADQLARQFGLEATQRAKKMYRKDFVKGLSYHG